MSAPSNPPTPETTVAADRRPVSPRDFDLARYDEYVDRVRRLCGESSGAQSALRAGLGKPVTEVPARMHAAILRPGLIRENTEGRAAEHKERAYYAVAALIAARPRAQRLAETLDPATPSTVSEPTAGEDGPGSPGEGPGDEAAGSGVGSGFRSDGTSLGETLALDAGRRSPVELKSGAAESRLHLLVRQDLDGVHRMLPSVFRWLHSSGVSPDYACLLRDLTDWRYGQDAVATRWLQGFYRSLRRQEVAATAGATASGTEKPAQNHHSAH
jgi:CRISPR system Cascade subunit CasB